MDRDVPHEVLDIRTTTQCVRYVAHVDGSPRQVNEIPDRVRRVNTQEDAAKAWTLVLARGGDAQISQRRTRLLGDVGDGEREARGHGGKQELGGLHAGVGTTTGRRFVNAQLELTDPHCAAVSPLPACCDLHNDGGI